jgi:thiamine-phosphate pyrophosphorylase
VTDGSIIALEDFPVRAAALAAAGPAVALHARDRSATAAQLTAVTRRLVALATPPGAAVFVNARPDIAVALQTHGVQLGDQDLSPGDVRHAFGSQWSGWIGCSVHSADAAARARDEGADFLLVGSIYPTPSHPGHSVGLGVIEAVATWGLPVIAIGGISAANVVEVRQAGAYGVATISAAWRADDCASAALQLLAPWSDAA